MNKARVSVVLEELDPITNSVINEIYFEADTASELPYVDELEQGIAVPLDAEECEDLKKRCRLGDGAGKVKGTLLLRRPPSNHSYKSHTNRELMMMLQGEKPFAVFTFHIDEEIRPELFADQPFDKYAAEGRLVKNQRTIAADRNGEETSSVLVMYALPGEEWRFEAYALLHEQCLRHGWCGNFERLQGRLLGYSEAQNDEHMKGCSKYWKCESSTGE